jgi:hypothetical protein
VVAEINRLHGETLDAARTSLDKAMRIGELLTQQKTSLEHGQWLTWIKANVSFSDQTARNYMRVYERRDDPKFKTVLNLADAYRLLSADGEDEEQRAAKLRVEAETFGVRFDEEQARDMARLRELDADLRGPELSLPRVHAIVEESGRLERAAHTRHAEALAMLGGHLNAAEDMGILEAVLTKVNRKAAGDGLAFIPKPGNWAIGSGFINGTHYFAGIMPYVQDGFFFVTVISSEREDGPGRMDFQKKAVPCAFVRSVLKDYVPFPEKLEWNEGPGERWEYNEPAYTSHEDYLNCAVLGKGAAA